MCVYVLISSWRRSVQTWKAWEMSTKSSLFTWACHQDQATCEVRSGQNSLSHEIPESSQPEEDEFDSINGSDDIRLLQDNRLLKMLASKQNYGPADSQLSKS